MPMAGAIRAYVIHAVVASAACGVSFSPSGALAQDAKAALARGAKSAADHQPPSNQAPIINCQAHQKEVQVPGAIHLALLYPADTLQHWAGARDACLDWRSKRKQAVVLRPEPYYTSMGGVARIRALLDEGWAHVIIGPADSSVLSDAIEHVPMPDAKPVPILSPTATSVIGNQPDGWYFRLNVDVVRRTETIFDYVRAAGVRHVGVLYVDDAFGQRAAQEFRQAVERVPGFHYVGAPFAKVGDARTAIAQVLAREPGAIGLFAERHQIDPLISELRNMHDRWYRHDPLLFTLVDARGVQSPDVHYVSIKSDAALQPEYSEQRALAADTTQLVLGIIDEMKPISKARSRTEWAERFRTRLLSLLLRPSKLEKQTRTSMRFEGLSNLTPLRIGATGSRGVIRIPAWEDDPLGSLVKRLDRPELYRRFGFAPLLNLLIVIVMTFAYSMWDLRSQAPRVRATAWPALKLALIHVVAAVGSWWFFLVAGGDVSPANTWAAAGAGASYAALIKVALSSPVVKGFALAKLYTHAVHQAERQIQRRDESRRNALIEYLTLANSRLQLRLCAGRIYARAQERARANGGDTPGDAQPAVQLEPEETLHERSRNEPSTLSRRRVYAEFIVDQTEDDWDLLRDMRLVPKESRHVRSLLDPRHVIEESARHCGQRGISVSELRQLVRNSLRGTACYAERFQEFEEELATSNTHHSQRATCLRWILLQNGFELSALPGDFFPSSIRRLQQVWSLRIQGGRRRAERRAAETQLRLTANGDTSGPQLVGRLVDYGAGGAALQLHTVGAESLDSLETLQIQFPDSAPEELRGQLVTARVVYTRESNPWLRVGVSWTALPSCVQEHFLSGQTRP